MASNDLTSRKDARAALATLLDAVTEIQQVYAYEPVTFDNQSPVVTVQSSAQYPRFEGSTNVDTHQFVVEVYVNAEDREDAEDLLDTIGLEIAEVVRGWHNALFFQPSATWKEIVDGIPYRGESHFIQVDWE